MCQQPFHGIISVYILDGYVFDGIGIPEMPGSGFFRQTSEIQFAINICVTSEMISLVCAYRTGLLIIERNGLFPQVGTKNADMCFGCHAFQFVVCVFSQLVAVVIAGFRLAESINIQRYIFIVIIDR